MDKAKLWGGAFTGVPDGLAWSFGQSIESDSAFAVEELDVSIAHVRMLGDQGLLRNAKVLINALEQMRSLEWLEKYQDAEDIHAAVETELIVRVGEEGERLRTARSRNDQIATVARLWTHRRCMEANDAIKEIQSTLVALAKKHADDPMPGYTHLQPAQPITFGFHLLTYFWMFHRDRKRFSTVSQDALSRCPMGAGSLAGTSLDIDRESVATELGFEHPSESAMDAVSDRDFLCDALHACALTTQHLSRLASELIFWSTPAFGFVTLGDAFSTGSSLMPQKRNPDTAELIRGRSAKVIGNYTSVMGTLRALPLAYNRDMQDDKPPLVESMMLTLASLRLTNGMLTNASFHTDAMRDVAGDGSSTATGLAEYLVKQGIPFRAAHEEAGKVVLDCERKGWHLHELTLEQLEQLTRYATPELLELLTVKGSIASRKSKGAPGELQSQIQLAEAIL